MTTAATLFGPVTSDLTLVEDALRTVQQAEHDGLARILRHVLNGGGKRLRPAIALLAGTFGRYRIEGLVQLAVGLELLHTASLVHDDVIDTSPMRRGRATANAIFDNAASVMVGDYIFANAAEFIARTGNLRVIRLFARTLMIMATGELDQDVSAYDHSKSIQDYFRRISGKTASLFATAGEGGAILADESEEQVEALRSYGYWLGMAFQIVDDILDFVGNPDELGKPAGSDLREGTLTLPSILLLERHPGARNPVARYFSARRRREQWLNEAVGVIREVGVLDEARRYARDFVDRAAESLVILPDTESRRTLVELGEFVLRRSK